MRKMNRRPAPLVLIVDDHADTREMYAMYLAHNGFRYVLAGEALQVDNRLIAPGGPALSGYALLWAEPGQGLVLARLGDERRVAVEVG